MIHHPTLFIEINKNFISGSPWLSASATWILHYSEIVHRSGSFFIFTTLNGSSFRLPSSGTYGSELRPTVSSAFSWEERVSLPFKSQKEKRPVPIWNTKRLFPCNFFFFFLLNCWIHQKLCCWSNNGTMKHDAAFLVFIIIWLVQMLHGSATTKRTDDTIQITKNNLYG